jgi:hypothetical protein
MAVGAKKRRDAKCARELGMLRAAVAERGKKAVAAELGASGQALHYWLSGARSVAKVAPKIASLYGAAAPPPPAPSPLELPDEDMTIPDTAKVAGQILRMLRDQLPSAPKDDLPRWCTAVIGACNALSKISGQREVTEVQVVRSAAFKRAMARIEKALEVHPGAWAALEESFASFGRTDA